MGRKKKPFIDKKRAQTFSLVPRSQKDPLHDDPNEAQYVLKQIQDTDAASSEPLLNKEERLTEQQKYGIYFDDDYDYLQHLKEPGATMLEPVHRDTLKPAAGDRKPQLPEELFGSEVRIEGRDVKVLPISGPQPGWDPDIVAALEAAETSNTVDDELEDDFVTMANGGEVGCPVYITEHFDDNGEIDGTPWWAGRGDFSLSGGKPTSPGSDLDEEDGSGVSSSRGGRQRSLQKRGAQFTEYSMSSSIVPRSEALTLLDDRFEQFMVDYDDSQLGAPEEADEEENWDLDHNATDLGEGHGKGGAMMRADYDRLLLESVVEDFERNFADKMHVQESEESDDSNECDTDSDSQKPPKLVPATSGAERKDGCSVGRAGDGVGGSADVSEEEEEEESERESRVLVEIDERPRERWDCESILSTYSNLYNHPTKIAEPSDPLKKQIKLSRKTGVPLGAVPGPAPTPKSLDQPPSRASITRPREESKEEKRARKQAIKEERRMRRTEKKATKLAFRSEELKLEKALAVRLPTAAVV